MNALQARSAPPVLRTAEAAVGILWQLDMLQSDASSTEHTKRMTETRREKAVYLEERRGLISIVMGEPVRATI
jgi:hypothetical protein